MTSSSSSLSLPDDSARPRRVPTAYGRSPFLPDGKCSMLTQESRKPLGVVGLDSDRDVDVCCLGRVCWNTVSSWSSVVVPFPDAFRFLFLLRQRQAKDGQDDDDVISRHFDDFDHLIGEYN